MTSRSAFRSDLFAGKVALVTGGGSGIGLGIARALAAHGAHVAILGRSAERLAAAIAGEPGDYVTLPCDVRAPAAIDDALAQLRARHGEVDVLVNAAAGNFLARAANLSPNGFRTVLEIDAAGTYNVSRAVFLAGMRERGGSIVNISATLHYGGTPLQVHAAAAKAAIDAMTRTLAVEWGPAGVRVNAVAPGPIAGTEGMDRLLPASLRERAEQGIPLRRMGTIEDVASTVLAIASDEIAGYVTGAVWVVDGGAWLPGGLGTWMQ